MESKAALKACPLHTKKYCFTRCLTLQTNLKSKQKALFCYPKYLFGVCLQFAVEKSGTTLF